MTALCAALIALATEGQEPRIAATGPEKEYLQAAHQRIHARWTDNFLMLAAHELPATNPLNDQKLASTAELVVSPEGRTESVRITASSGNADFDGAAVDVLRGSYPAPPPALLSDDGRLHLSWTLARDDRRCSGVAWVQSKDPLDVAVPKLLKTNRLVEIVTRANTARAAGTEPAMSALARGWLVASLGGPAGLQAATTLAGAGDHSADAFLKAAIEKPESAADAGAALKAVGVAVCPLVKDRLAAADANQRLAAARALTHAGEADCAAPLTALLENKTAPPPAREAAALAVGRIKLSEPPAALSAATKDPDAAVRAAAILGSARGAGRTGVVRMVKHFGDPAPEVRAAAAVAALRAGGDAALPDLAFLRRESDPRAVEPATRELAKLASPESARFLGQLLKNGNAKVRLHAAAALAARRDAPARAALKPFVDAKDPALRKHALVAADKELLLGLKDDPAWSVAACRALLGAGHRDAAADVLLASLAKWSPADRLDVMIGWLAIK